MKIRSFYLNSEEEVIVRIVKEILALFHIHLTEDSAEPVDYEQVSIENHRLPGKLPSVKSVLTVKDPAGKVVSFCQTGTAHADEREGAAIHRLIKWNLYHIFRTHFAMPPAPWGILHGVRPTKIVHRFIGQGLQQAAIVERLQEDYAASPEKAAMLTKLAFRQLPFLATSDEKTVSIYVGIPFCLSRCLYCSFPAYVLPGTDKLRTFMDVFRKDLLAVREAVEKYDLKVQNIYVGGGTPTSLPEDFFDEMLHLVYNAFYGPFTGEFTVEAGRPDSMSEGKIASMKKYHVSRVSVNPQTMQARTLKRIGRNHTPEDIVTMFHALRKAGIPHINMDLILGLPGETTADVADTMEKISALDPDDITLHALALKRGSRLKMHLEEIELPDDETTQQMFYTAMQQVEKLGMEPYYLYRQGYMSGQLENVGCCRPGAEGMYNIQIMEEHQTILGIGGAAATKVVGCAGGRMKTSFNAKDLATYLTQVDKYIEKRALLLEEAYQK